MPNKNTFDIRSIRALIDRYNDGGFSIDPFANTNRIATITNDIDSAMGCDYCMDAVDFIKLHSDLSVDLTLYDPPYSPRQVSGSYRKLGMSVNMETTQSSFWSKLKKEISRVTKINE